MKLARTFAVLGALWLLATTGASAYPQYQEEANARMASANVSYWLYDSVGGVSHPDPVVITSNDSAWQYGAPERFAEGGPQWVWAERRWQLDFELGQSRELLTRAMAGVDSRLGLARLTAEGSSFSQFVNQPPLSGTESYGVWGWSTARIASIYTASLSDAAAAAFSSPRVLRLPVTLSGEAAADAVGRLDLRVTGRANGLPDTALQSHEQQWQFSGDALTGFFIDLSLDSVQRPYASWLSCATWDAGRPGVNCPMLNLFFDVTATLSVQGSGSATVDLRLGRPELLDDSGVLASLHGADWGLPGAQLAQPVPEPASALLALAGLMLLVWRRR
ncbi:MAG: hypothetical protein ACK44A_01060 [Roseateles sp.]